MTQQIVMFPGQGSQFKGMGENLFKVFPEKVEIASRVLGYDIVELCLNDPDHKLNQTNFTQPAVFFINYLSYLKFLQEHKTPDYFIGHSLGEFNALNAAGVFDFETGLKIVQKRGELMYSIGDTSMAAVIGGSYKEIVTILNQQFPDIDIANINSQSQIVISGKIESLNNAADVFEDEGFMYIPLKVSGAFHSRYMTPIKDKFANFIETIELNKCTVPVISNYAATLYPLDREGTIKNMANQINSPIRWLQSIEYFMNQGETDFIEVGPGEVLSNLIKKIKNSSKITIDSTVLTKI